MSLTNIQKNFTNLEKKLEDVDKGREEKDKICDTLKIDMDNNKKMLINNFKKLVCLKELTSKEINKLIETVKKKGLLNTIVGIAKNEDSDKDFGLNSLVTLNKKKLKIICLEFKKYHIYYSSNIKEFIKKNIDSDFPSGKIIDQSFDKSLFLVEFDKNGNVFWFHKEDLELDLSSSTEKRIKGGYLANNRKRSIKKKMRGGKCEDCNQYIDTLFPNLMGQDNCGDNSSFDINNKLPVGIGKMPSLNQIISEQYNLQGNSLPLDIRISELIGDFLPKTEQKSTPNNCKTCDSQFDNTLFPNYIGLSDKEPVRISHPQGFIKTECGLDIKKDSGVKDIKKNNDEKDIKKDSDTDLITNNKKTKDKKKTDHSGGRKKSYKKNKYIKRRYRGGSQNISSELTGTEPSTELDKKKDSNSSIESKEKKDTDSSIKPEEIKDSSQSKEIEIDTDTDSNLSTKPKEIEENDSSKKSQKKGIMSYDSDRASKAPPLIVLSEEEQREKELKCNQKYNFPTNIFEIENNLKFFIVIFLRVLQILSKNPKFKLFYYIIINIFYKFIKLMLKSLKILYNIKDGYYNYKYGFIVLTTPLCISSEYFIDIRLVNSLKDKINKFFDILDIGTLSNLSDCVLKLIVEMTLMIKQICEIRATFESEIIK